MKKLLFILAALCCTMVASAQSTPPNNEIWYTSTDGKVVTPNVVYYFNVGITSNEYKNGKGILTFAGDLTSIGDYAFTNCSSLATIAIPSSVTNIGKYAFTNCSSLATIAIPSSVTNIGVSAFLNCTDLTSITVGGSVGKDAFAGCTNLKSVTIKDGTTIGEYAFKDCKGEFIFEGCVKEIGKYGFLNCTGLTSITVSGSIGDYAFDGCTHLKSVTIKDGTTIGMYAFRNCTGLTSITVNGSVGKDAFNGCTNLKTVTVKDGTTIGEKAFYNYNGEFIFEGCVTNVGNDAFSNCTGLTSITVSGSIGNDAFADCTNLKTVTIKDGTTIGMYAFRNCTGLTSITVNGSVGKDAFNGCTNLKTVTVKDGTSIGEKAFYDYKGEFIFEGCVKEIGKSAFQNCLGLTSITVSGSGSVGESAFEGCTNLKSVTIKDGTSIGQMAFDGYNGEFNFEGCVMNVGMWAFQNCPGLTSITVGGSVGEQAFLGCTNLKSVTIKDGTSIEGSAFNSYNGEFIFEGCVTNVGYLGFQNCTGLTSITVSGSVGRHAFAGCTNLKLVTVKDGTSIGQMAFDGYKGAFIFEGCVTNVGYEAFRGCTNLESITINDCPNMGEYAFMDCSGLKSMVINSDTPPLLDGKPEITFRGVNPDIPIYVNNAAAYYRSEWGKYFTNFIGNMISHKSQAVNEINAQRQGITLSEEEVAAIEACIKTINDIPDGARMTDERLATIKEAEAAALAIINKDKFRKEKDAATAEVAALVPKGLTNDYLTEVLQEQMNAINAANTIVGLNAAKENAIAVINKALAVSQAFLGTLGTKQSGHSVEVTDQNGQVIKLYNPKTVMYVKVKEDGTDAPGK